jgi:hypothetical protein
MAKGQVIEALDGWLWGGRKSGENKKEAEKPGWQRRSEASELRICLEKDRSHGIGGSWQVTPGITLSEAASTEKALYGMPATKNQRQAGKVPATEQLGEAFCGGVGSAGLLGGAKPKDRWLQALLSPAPNAQGMVSLSQQGQMSQCRRENREKDVPAFNAIEELNNCRVWLRNLRGEVEAGLQRIEKVLQHVSVTGPVQDRWAMDGVSRPIRLPEPSGETSLIPKASYAGPGLGPMDRGCIPIAGLGSKTSSAGLAGLDSCSDGALVGLGLKASSAGPAGLDSNSEGAFVGLSDGEWPGPTSGLDGPAKEVVTDPRLLARPAGIDKVGPSGLADGRLGKHVPTGIPTTHLSGSSATDGSFSEKGVVSEVRCSESTRKRGTTGLIQRPPAMEDMEPTRLSPVRAQFGTSMPTDPPQSQIRVYQRSRGRVLKPLQSRTTPWLTGNSPGSSAAVSPVRLDFDGVGADLCDSKVISSAPEYLGAAMGSADVVPETVAGEDLPDQGAASCSAEFVSETVAGEDLSDSSKVVARPGEAGELNFTLHVGGIMGMTCDGQVEQLREVVGNLVAKKHGSGVAGERGSQVSYEL